MLNRRDLLTSVSLMAVMPPALAQGWPVLALQGVQRQIGERQFPALGFSEPLLRLKRPASLIRKLENKLDQPTELISLGMRLEGGKAGGKGFATGTLAPQSSTDFSAAPMDSGTFLLRPPFTPLGQQQVAAGLCAIMVVEEPVPLLVDRDVPLLLQDWTQHLATLPAPAPSEKTETDKSESKDAPKPAANPAVPLTANGEHGHAIAVKLGERLRLRIANGSPCSILEVTITDHDAYLVAFDGFPSDLFKLERSSMVLAPGQRADVLVDCMKGAGTAAAIIVANGQGQTEAAKIVYDKTDIWRRSAVPLPPPLPLSALPYEMNFSRAQRAQILCAKTDRGWALGIGGKAVASSFMRVKRQSVVMLAFENKSDTYHCVSVEGHPFRLLDGRDDGWKPYWLNSVLVAPQSITRVAFRADVAGKWPINWTIVGDIAAGPTTIYEVS